MLVTLSVATSIDAAAVGMGMAFVGASIWWPAIVIGVVAAVLSSLGIGFAGRLGRQGGRAAEIAGGCILILTGLRILASHLGG